MAEVIPCLMCGRPATRHDVPGMTPSGGADNRVWRPEADVMTDDEVDELAFDLKYDIAGGWSHKETLSRLVASLRAARAECERLRATHPWPYGRCTGCSPAERNDPGATHQEGTWEHPFCKNVIPATKGEANEE